MPNENYRASLSVNNALGRSDIIGERCRRILNDCDRVAVLPQNVIYALPTRAVNKTTVYENNGLCFHTSSFSHDDLLLSNVFSKAIGHPISPGLLLSFCVESLRPPIQ